MLLTQSQAATRATLLLAVTAASVGAGLLLRRRRLPGFDAAPLDQLSYPDVVEYFVQHAPVAEGLNGALLRQKDAAGWKMSFVFLDGDGQIRKAKGNRRGKRSGCAA